MWKEPMTKRCPHARLSSHSFARYTAFAGLLLWGCFDSVGSQTLVLRTAETHPHDYPTTVALRHMSDWLADSSDEELQLKIYSGGQLGEEKDAIELTILGAIDIARVSLAPLNAIAAETTVFSMPFLFRSIEHMRAVLDGEIGVEVLEALNPHGLVGLAYYDSGARSIYNSQRPIRAPEDIVGLKVRVQNSDAAVAMIEAMGGNPTPMGFGQVYESLMLGAIDASENNWPSYEAAGHYEVAKHYTLTRHTMVPDVVVVSKLRWERLDANQKELLRRAAARSVQVMRNAWDERVELAQRRLVAEGIQVIENIDAGPFVTAVEPVYRRFMNTPRLLELVDRIRTVEPTD